MIHRRRSVGLAMGVAVMIAVASVLIASCSSASKSRSAAPPKPAPLAAPRASAGRAHGTVIDDLDATISPGVSLDEGLRRFGRNVSLPDPSLVGTPRKVVVDDSGESPSDYVLLIGYDSGIKLEVEPGDHHVQKALRGDYDFVQFSDGRRHPFEVQMIAGRKTVVRRRGTQVLPSGIPGARTRYYELPGLLMWVEDGLEYSLQDGSGSTFAETPSTSISMDDLIRVAASIR